MKRNSSLLHSLAFPLIAKVIMRDHEESEFTHGKSMRQLYSKANARYCLYKNPCDVTEDKGTS